MISQTLDLFDFPEDQVTLSLDTSMQTIVRGSRFELTQVLVNLIRNALQACQSKGVSPKVNISVRRQHKNVLVSIADNGPGFSTESLIKAGAAIFTTRDEGMGLGLWISQEIVERHVGKLIFANGPHGALVSIRLPLVEGV